MTTIAKFQVLGSVSKGQVANNALLISSFSKLTLAEAASAAATTGLDYATLEATLTAAGFNLEQRNEIAMMLLDIQAKKTNTTVTTGLAGATGGLSAALKGLWIACKPMLILGAIALAATALYKAIDNLTESAEEAQDRFNDATSDIQKFESEASAISNELEAVEKDLTKLKNIAESSTLTPNQQEEMENLQARSEELQRQLDIQEKLAEYAAKEASDAAKASIGKTTYSIGTGEMTMTDDGVWMTDTAFVNGATAIQWYTDQMASAYARIDELNGNLELLPEDSDQIPELTGQIDALKLEISGYESAVAGIIPEQLTWANAIADENDVVKIAILGAIDSFNELVSAHDTYVSTAEETIASFVDLETAISNFSTTVESMEKVKDLLESLAEVDGSQLPIDIYNDIISLYPAAAAEIKNVADAQNFLNGKMEDLRSAAETAYGQIRVSNEEWVTSTIEASDTLKKNLAILYNEDLANFNEFAKQKWIVEKGLVEDLMVLWNKYISFTTPEIESMLRYENYEAFNPNEDRIRELQNILEIRKKMEADFSNLGDFSSGSNSGKTPEEIAAEKAREAFEKEYNAWKYKLDMEQITLEEFYDWLDGEKGYQAYFEAQGETLEDFRKYSKEVFDGLRDVHEDYLSYLDYEISVLKRQEDSENAVIEKYAQKRAVIHELAKELKKYLESEGMSEQEIMSNDQYRAYMDMIYSIEDEIASIQEEAFDKTKGYVNNLISLTEDYIKQLKEDEKDALEETRSEYEKILEAQKEMLNLTREQDTYERDKAERLKTIRKLQEQIAALELDDSREAQIKKAELIEQLNKEQLELDDLQTEHYISSAEDAYDKAGESFSESIDDKIDTIDEFLKDNEAINQAALEKLDNMNEELFENLMDYAETYTDTTRAEMLAMWEEVTAAAEKYGSVTNASKVYEDGDVGNEVQEQLERMRRNGQEYARTTDENRKQWLANDSLEAGEELERLLKVTVERDKNGVWWIGDGADRRKLFEIYSVEKHHVGTAAVGGNPTFKQNEVFALLEKDETVLTKKHVDTLWSFLNNLNPAKWMRQFDIKNQTVALKNNGSGAPTVMVDAPVYVDGSMSDQQIMKILKTHAYDVADMVAAKLRR